MGNREEKRNLETIPVGSLGIIALKSCQQLSEKIDQYLVKWRTERENEHKDSLAFSGYQRPSYLLGAKVPRFGSGEAKGVILESVRGSDLYLLVDVPLREQTAQENRQRVSGLCACPAGAGSHGCGQYYHL